MNIKEHGQVVQDLRKEAVELEERIDKLIEALLSDGFLGKVGKVQFILMSKQLAGMQSYLDTLRGRMVNLIANDTVENQKTKSNGTE